MGWAPSLQIALGLFALAGLMGTLRRRRARNRFRYGVLRAPHPSCTRDYAS